MNEELAQNTEEQVTTPTEETLEELGDASGSESEPSGKSTEGETESGEQDKEGDESDKETYEKSVTSLAQSIAAKSNLTITKQRDDALGQVTKLQEELDDKIWTRENELVFQEEGETLGEDEAKKRKVHREHIEAQNKDFRQRDAKVNQILAKLGNVNLDEILETLKVTNLTEGIEKVSFNVRNNKIRDELWPLIFPEDKVKSDLYNKYLKKFDKVGDSDDIKLVMGGIRETIKAKSKPFVPHSSKVGGGGVSDKQIMENYQKDPKNPDNAKAYSELRQRKGLTS